MILGGFDFGRFKSICRINNPIVFQIIKSQYNMSLEISIVFGGDWSEDRLIPDCIKSWGKNAKMQ